MGEDENQKLRQMLEDFIGEGNMTVPRIQDVRAMVPLVEELPPDKQDIARERMLMVERDFARNLDVVWKKVQAGDPTVLSPMELTFIDKNFELFPKGATEKLITIREQAEEFQAQQEEAQRVKRANEEAELKKINSALAEEARAKAMKLAPDMKAQIDAALSKKKE